MLYVFRKGYIRKANLNASEIKDAESRLGELIKVVYPDGRQVICNEA